MDQPILVTGATGFVGGAVVGELLVRGYSVRATGRRPRPPGLPAAMEYRRADLGDPGAAADLCGGVGAVVHTAARAGVWGPWRDYRRDNLEATRHLLEGARAAGARAMVFTSTPSVVFRGRPIRGGDESLPYGERFPCAYPATKAEAEKEVLAADGEGGLRTLALRPHLIWGPGDPHLFPRVFAKARAGQLRQVGRGGNRVDLTWIEDVARGHADALEALLRGEAAGRPYFLTQDEPVELWPFVREVLRRAGLPAPGRAVPFPVAWAAGVVAEGVWAVARRPGEPPMTRFVAHELAEDHWFSPRAAREAFGYRPRVSMAEGLERYFAEEGVGAGGEPAENAAGRPS